MLKSPFFIVLLLLLLLGVSLSGYAQFPDSVNEVENKILPYTLPDPLQLANGDRIKNAKQWEAFQRPYIYYLFEENVYGRYPRKKIPVQYKIREQSNKALNGLATRKQIRIYLKPGDPTVFIDVLMYLPKNRKGAVPVFLGLNFKTNASIQLDPHILRSEKPVKPDFKIPDNDSLRGVASSRWPVKTIIQNGFGVVTAYYGDIELDKPDGWKTGVRNKLQKELDIKPEEWAAISAWAWGLGQIMDYLETDADVDASKVAIFGHSRLGKTSLWAGASDRRFSIVISNDSGEGGAALARRWFGETVQSINNQFPHWFVKKYKSYGHDVFDLPVDQHELLALIAPRPLYVATAEDDLWSDPKGQFLSAWHAGEAYHLYGEKGMETSEMPPVNTPIGNTIGYHNRTGIHDINLYDWKQYLKFAKKCWASASSAIGY